MKQALLAKAAFAAFISSTVGTLTARVWSTAGCMWRQVAGEIGRKMWMQIEVDHVPGFGDSTLYSPDDERFTFVAAPASTTEEIADRIVALGSRGLWTLTTDPYQRDGGWTDALKVDPYQHYSNLPNTDH